jgi:hypothetical protein
MSHVPVGTFLCPAPYRGSKQMQDAAIGLRKILLPRTRVNSVVRSRSEGVYYGYCQRSTSRSEVA